MMLSRAVLMPFRVDFSKTGRVESEFNYVPRKLEVQHRPFMQGGHMFLDLQ